MITRDFVFLLYLGLFFMDAISAEDVRSVLKGDYTDAGLVTWAHAVNSPKALDSELEGPANFLEADVSLGHVSGNEAGPPIPIMAHPPNVTSDISLERWLDIVIARRKDKGVKLDFKSIDIVEPSLLIIQRHKAKLQFPLWLNADILPGPEIFHTMPVSAEKFLALCQHYFPNATLSVGWTTYWIPKGETKNAQYSWMHVREMVDTLKCLGNMNNAPVTFPVRGIFASSSIAQLRWLLEIFPQATLTVWSGKYDFLKFDDLRKIRNSFPKARVFYDIPGKIGREFREKMEDIQMDQPGEPTFVDHNFVKMTKGQNMQSPTCSSDSYVTRRTIMFGKDSETLVFLKQMLVVTDERPLRVQGEVIFFGNELSIPSNEQPQLILALAEAKTFSKDFTSQEEDRSEDDTNISWVALNSSQLHVFKHEGSLRNTSCHLFRLDTTSKKQFEAWTVDCELLKKDPTEDRVSGKSEVSPEKWLVLPTGPLVFGVISSGGGYVAVNDLILKNAESNSSGASSASYFKVLFLFILLTCFTLLISLFTDQCIGSTLLL